MLFRLQPEVLALLIPVLLFALVFHEFSHGWVAYKLGDPTAKHQGRLTLNPIAHLDLMGSMALLIMGFGWAKPVPVNEHRLQPREQGMMWVALAGPLSNVCIAVVCSVLLKLALLMGPELVNQYRYVLIFLRDCVVINIVLAVFNMIPIPPLDGSRVIMRFLPASLQSLMIRVEPYGMMIVILLAFFGFLSVILTATVPPILNWLL